MSSTTELIASSTGQSWLIGPIRPIGRRHGRDGKQQGHERREQRAESENQDHERYRKRGDLRLLEVVLEGLGERLVGAAVAELLDAEVAVLLVERRDRFERRVNLVLGVLAGDSNVTSAERPSSEQLPGVVAPVGAVHVLHVPGALEPRHQLGDHAAELRVARAGGGLALDEDALVRVARGSGRTPPCRRGRTRRCRSRRRRASSCRRSRRSRRRATTNASQPRIAFLR